MIIFIIILLVILNFYLFKFNILKKLNNTNITFDNNNVIYNGIYIIVKI